MLLIFRQLNKTGWCGQNNYAVDKLRVLKFYVGIALQRANVPYEESSKCKMHDLSKNNNFLLEQPSNLENFQHSIRQNQSPENFRFFNV